MLPLALVPPLCRRASCCTGPAGLLSPDGVSCDLPCDLPRDLLASCGGGALVRSHLDSTRYLPSDDRYLPSDDRYLPSDDRYLPSDDEGGSSAALAVGLTSVDAMM